MTLDELLIAARAEPGPGKANDRFWLALDSELRRCFARYSHDTAAELTQRALLVVLRKIDRYQQTGSNSLRRWVRVIAANEARHTRWRAARLVRLESKVLRETAFDPGLTPSAYVLSVERIDLARDALAKLSPTQRMAITAFDVHELAASERITVDAARMRIHRTICKLGELIDAARKTNRVRIVTPS